MINIKPFSTNVPLLYPLKISDNLRLSTSQIRQSNTSFGFPRLPQICYWRTNFGKGTWSSTTARFDQFISNVFYLPDDIACITRNMVFCNKQNELFSIQNCNIQNIFLTFSPLRSIIYVYVKYTVINSIQNADIYRYSQFK